MVHRGPPPGAPAGPGAEYSLPLDPSRNPSVTPAPGDVELGDGPGGDPGLAPAKASSSRRLWVWLVPLLVTLVLGGAAMGAYFSLRKPAATVEPQAGPSPPATPAPQVRHGPSGSAGPRQPVYPPCLPQAPPCLPQARPPH